jgi:hypothetical protein
VEVVLKRISQAIGEPVGVLLPDGEQVFLEERIEYVFEATRSSLRLHWRSMSFPRRATACATRC